MALRTLPMPCLSVQPLVENAVKHGIAPAIRGGAVRVAAHLENGASRQVLVVTVENTGAPLVTQSDRRDARVGLSNVERRLTGHFGQDASLTLDSTHGVTVAEVRVPLRAHVDQASDGPAIQRAAG
jgi:LytS/YehU family sensor histidine kinase